MCVYYVYVLFLYISYGFNSTIICRRHLADLETRDRVTHYAFTLVSSLPTQTPLNLKNGSLRTSTRKPSPPHRSENWKNT